MFQRQVNPCSQEARSENETTDLNLKAGLIPGILMHKESADVTKEFAKAANRHPCHV